MAVRGGGSRAGADASGVVRLPVGGRGGRTAFAGIVGQEGISLLASLALGRLLRLCL